MRAHIRKNEFLPKRLEGVVAEDLFRHLEAHPQTAQSKRIAHILEALSRLARGDWHAFSQLDDLLTRYEWHYGLIVEQGSLRAEPIFARKLLEKEDKWEHLAVRFLMSLVPDRIDRLRRCRYEGCRGWFFADKRYDQNFCKRSSCRQNYYDSDPGRRERKKAKMRENRRWHREQNRKAKERSRGRKGQQKRA